MKRLRLEGKTAICRLCGDTIGTIHEKDSFSDIFDQQIVEDENAVSVPPCLSCVTKLAMEQMTAMFCLLAEETAKKCMKTDDDGIVRSILNGLVCQECGRPQFQDVNSKEAWCDRGHKGKGVEFGTWTLQMRRKR